jgi:two-component system cell cycle response regulator
MTGTERSHRCALLVTEDSTVREGVERAISGLVRLDHRSSSEQAIDYLESVGTDLVLLDGELEGGDCWRLAERLRGDRRDIELVLLCSEDAGAQPEIRDEWLAEVVSRSAPERSLRRSIARVLEHRDLARANRRLEQAVDLHRRCRALTSCLDSGKVYPATLDLMLAVLGRPRGIAIFHRTSIPDNEAFAFRGLEESEQRLLRAILSQQKPLEENFCGDLQVVEGGPFVQVLREAGIDAERSLAVPLMGPDDEIGMIWLLEDGRPFDKDELARVRDVLGYAETAMDNSERYHHAKERAFIDDVTEIYNARYLLSTTDNEIRRAERYENPLSVLFLDLDRFKLVNDRHGHLVGSQTLRSLSQVLLQCVREVDTLARYGGDEFTILLVDTDHASALVVAERIRRTVEGHVFEAGRDAATLQLTVSLGVSTYPNHGLDRSALLDAADKAMYRSKSLGRNRVSSAGDLAE